MKALLLLLLLPLLGGCQLMPKPQPPPRGHDLGPRPQVKISGQLAAALRQGTFTGVKSAPWIATQEIHYRFEHDWPTWLRAYANSRWVAPPPRLIEQRLRQELGLLRASPARDSRFRWRVQLDTFEQRFAAKDKARAVLVARVVITGPEGATVEREVSLRRRCRPDIRGAVDELPELADQAVAQILDIVGRQAAADPRIAGR